MHYGRLTNLALFFFFKSASGWEACEVHKLEPEFRDVLACMSSDRLLLLLLNCSE
jgi:hypothetical protein